MAAAPAIRAATNEAFRLLPTAPFLARLLDAPMTIAGHKLPAGVNTILSHICYQLTVKLDLFLFPPTRSETLSTLSFQFSH